jgi:hypothetical protein
VGSSSPWRSELVISPCVPFQMVRPLGMALHIKSYALHGLISHRDNSNVNHISSSILLNICINPLIHQPIAQRLEKRKRRPIGLVSTRKGKFPEISHPSHVSEVMWLGDFQTCVCREAQGCISITCGCLCRRQVVPVMDAFFPSPFCLYSFYSCFILLFDFFVRELTKGHCLGMVTRVDSITHKYFHRDEKVGS